MTKKDDAYLFCADLFRNSALSSICKERLEVSYKYCIRIAPLHAVHLYHTSDIYYSIPAADSSASILLLPLI